MRVMYCPRDEKSRIVTSWAVIVFCIISFAIIWNMRSARVKADYKTCMSSMSDAAPPDRAQSFCKAFSERGY